MDYELQIVAFFKKAFRLLGFLELKNIISEWFH